MIPGLLETQEVISMFARQCLHVGALHRGSDSERIGVGLFGFEADACGWHVLLLCPYL